MSIEEIIKKIEHGKFPMSAQNASDYARGYNVGIEDAVEVVEECLRSNPLHPPMECDPSNKEVLKDLKSLNGMQVWITDHEMKQFFNKVMNKYL